MADARRTVNIAFDGNTNGLRRAGADANSILTRVGKQADAMTGSLTGMFRKFVIFGPLVLTVAYAAKAAAGFLLLIPAALLVVGAAFGVTALAVSGFNDAVSAMTPEEFVTATRSMSPAMRQAVDEVRNARPEFYALRRLVEEGFWTGFSTDLSAILDRYLPILQARLPPIAGEIAGIRGSIARLLLRPDIGGAIDRILANTAIFLDGMRRSLELFLSGFIRLGDIGSGALPRLLDLIERGAAAFDSFVRTGDASGSIAAFIRQSIDDFDKLWQVALNLYHTITAIIDALTGGQGGLNALVTFSAGLRAFFESDFAQTLLIALTQVLSVILNITAALAQLLAGTGSTGGTGGGFLAGVSGFLGGLFGRAGGGPVLAGQSYVVGERGREILTMGGDGFVTPNSQVGTPGGGGDVHVTVMIGNTELRDIVTSEIRRDVRDVARSVYSGEGLDG